VGWCVVVMQTSALCAPVVWVFSPDILPHATQDIVNRTLSALMDESTDIFHIFVSPTSRWTTYSLKSSAEVRPLFLNVNTIQVSVFIHGVIKKDFFSFFKLRSWFRKAKTKLGSNSVFVEVCHFLGYSDRRTH